MWFWDDFRWRPISTSACSIKATHLYLISCGILLVFSCLGWTEICMIYSFSMGSLSKSSNFVGTLASQFVQIQNNPGFCNQSWRISAIPTWRISAWRIPPPPKSHVEVHYFSFSHPPNVWSSGCRTIAEVIFFLFFAGSVNTGGRFKAEPPIPWNITYQPPCLCMKWIGRRLSDIRWWLTADRLKNIRFQQITYM